MRRVLREGRYDIVHVHSPLTPVLPLLAIDEAEVPGGRHLPYLLRPVDRLRAVQPVLPAPPRRLSAAIAVSPSTTVALDRYFKADWKIIPNGIDVEVFNPDAPRPPEIRTDVPSILFLGRFDPRNGLDTLIEAFRRVKARGYAAQLVVVGDGPLRDHYYALANNDPDITFVGSVLEGRPSYYANCSMYACPTTKASFGITLLESMACETPIVCSDILGFRDVVENNREAVMVPRGDTDALADAIVRLIDDETLRLRLGKRGREESLQYDWSRVTEQVLDVYHSVLGRLALAP